MIATAYLINASNVALLKGNKASELEQDRTFFEAESDAVYLGTLLPYLKTQGVDFLSVGEYSRILNKISEEQGATHLLLLRSTLKENEFKLSKIDSSEDQLTIYFEEFNEWRDDGAGSAMIEWLEVLRNAARADEHRDLLVRIG